ncbi:glycoside hydrolase domain-containing protein [uncultured Parabacteroides sp.]|uniref:glycoside hydrolase domain-containing protein n=1 Tax=uncultured Parabacteroides sp. TaxID=512312 RepID=UPI00259BEC50|nr:glycoside hydrolase domain-containing protein [uncultured Parabacteroides sp.]
MKQLLFTLFCLFTYSSLQAQVVPTDELYGVGTWNADSLGNHRVVVAVDKPADAVLATIDWRRRDLNPEAKNLIVVDAATGERITNVCRFAVDRERGEVAFQPQTVPGEYYIYYLKNVMSGSPYYPTVNYPAFENTASADWVKKNKLSGKKAPALPAAKVVQFQAINELNSFYPMEVIATSNETARLLKERPGEKYILFTEDRKFPIRMTTDIPYKWIADNRHDFFNGQADKGEYYVFQLGVWAARSNVENLHVDFSALTNKATGEQIPASSFTCFNTEGTDVTGTVFEKNCSVDKGKVQALWVGTQLPEHLSAGTYQGTVTVSAANAESKAVQVSLNVSENVIANHGDNEPWRHSRLRWLNSQIGFDDEVIAPYTPLVMKDKTISCLGREVKLSDLGLPEHITSYFKETMTGIGTNGRSVLAAPMELAADGGAWENLNFEITKHKQGAIAWKALNQNSRFLMDLEGEMESDGNIAYKVTLVAREDASVEDVALRTHLASGVGRYMMGLGEKGGYCPNDLRWKWDVEKNQDAVWVGDVNAGIQIRLYDNKYERPLNTNFYHQKPLHMPVSWCNAGNGGIDIHNAADGTRINAYSGKRSVKKGDRLYYYFNLALTPFRPIDTDKQWRERYHHNYEFLDGIQKRGANVINIHHANAINPFINYPFLRTKEMKAYIDGAHARDMKVKIYNTVRELSNSCVEMFALRSLGNEIFSEGPGGGFSWLQEHLDQNYIGAWFVPGLKDAAIVNSGVSRWHNYYLEGLDWLMKNVGIDGLYIDDLAFDRMTMKRIRKVMNRTNPSAMIDLHSANQYNPKDGFANSANLYLEHFPYLDRLWFGEYFNYDFPPEFWLVEVSGIPYGLMGEMLEGGGNPWRGMLFGMTGRSPRVDNGPLWKLWDSFGMQNSEMIGYWVKDNPVKTGSEKTLATVYSHMGDKALISLATWEDTDAKVKLSIDWAKLGLDPSKVTLHAPAIENFQQEATWKPGDEIVVPKGKGLLIIAK